MPNAAGRFTGPWRPGSDPYNADPGSLLRADNTVRDEEGIRSLRQGSRLLSTLSGGKPVVSLFSVVLNGRESVVAADSSDVYVDGTVLGAETGSENVALGAVRGHLLIISGANRHKYDGTTLRNWGIAAPLAAPTVSATDVSTKTVANFTQASAEFTASEGTRSYQTGVDGVANAATGMVPALGTGRAIMSYVFASAQNLLDIQGNKGGDYDMFSIWVDDPQPEKFTYMDIDIGISSGSDPFLTDYYHYRLGSILEPVQVQLTSSELAQAADARVAAVSEPEPTPPPPGTEKPDRGGGIEDRVPIEERRQRRSRTGE